METREHTHDFSSQYTKDGYEIRAVLKNMRPKLDFRDISYDAEDKREIMANLSNGLFLFAEDFRLQRDDKTDYESN